MRGVVRTFDDDLVAWLQVFELGERAIGAHERVDVRHTDAAAVRRGELVELLDASFHDVIDLMETNGHAIFDSLRARGVGQVP